MRLLHFLEYDISEGLIRFWRRYLWLIVLVFITCLLLDRASGDYLGMYGESWSPLGYMVNEFWGQRPFHFNQNTPDQFRLPLACMDSAVYSACILHRKLCGRGYAWFWHAAYVEEPEPCVMVEFEMHLLCLHQPVLFSAALWHDIRICVDFDW